MRKIFNALLTILGIITLLTGVVLITEYIITGILLIAIAVILIPFTQKKLLPKKHFPTPFRIIIIFTLLLVAFIFAESNTTDKEKCINGLNQFVKANPNNLIVSNVNFIQNCERLFSAPLSEIQNNWNPFDLDTMTIESFTISPEYTIVVRPKCSPNDSKIIFLSNYIEETDQIKGTLGITLKVTFTKDFKVKTVSQQFELVNNGKVSIYEDSTINLRLIAKHTEIKRKEDEVKKLIGKYRSKKLKEESYSNRKISFENNCLSDWDGSCPPLVSKTKKLLHNPNSFKHVETRYLVRDSDFYVEMIFRAKNGFGTTVISTATAIISDDCKLNEFAME